MGKSLKYFLKIFLLLVVLLIMACHNSPDLYKRTFSETEKETLGKQILAGVSSYYYQGSPQEIFLIEEGLKHSPESADLWREHGAPSIKRGAGNATYKYYGKAVALDPLEWQGWRGYLYLYFYRDYKRALSDFDATDILTPDFVDYPQSTSVDFMRGICYMRLNNYEKSFEFFERHIQECIKTVGEDYIDTRVYLYRGIMFFNEGKIDEARNTFRDGLKNVDGRNADLWFWIAKTETSKDKILYALDQATMQYKDGYYHHRTYVEEFYQTYLAEIEEMKIALQLPKSN